MEIIYSKKDTTDKEQAKLIRQMEYIHNQCVDLPLSCCCYSDKWGVWLTIGNKRWLADPIELVNSLFVDDTYTILISQEGVEWKFGCVAVRKDTFCMIWDTNHPDSPIKRRLMFRFDEYVAQITTSVIQLYEAVKAGGTVCYSKYDLNIEALAMAVAQLRIKSVLPNVYRLRANNVVEELFEFTPLSCDQYRIGIGDRHFTTFMEHWRGSMELIRHQLESVFYGEDATIKIANELDGTVLKIEHRSILDEVICVDDGYRYTYKEYAKVTIQSHAFELTPVIVGYCNYKDTIRTFYEGLLHMALLHDNEKYDHTPGRIEAYNMYKSPLIEHLLSNEKGDSCKSSTRQVRVKEIVIIDPDYDSCLINHESCAIDISDLLDEQSTPVEMPELEAWCSEIKAVIVESAVGRDVAFDWADWHRRGIELAKQLRKQLPVCYDLWYSAPSEDKSGIIKDSILII